MPLPVLNNEIIIWKTQKSKPAKEMGCHNYYHDDPLWKSKAKRKQPNKAVAGSVDCVSSWCFLFRSAWPLKKSVITKIATPRILPHPIKILYFCTFCPQARASTGFKAVQYTVQQYRISVLLWANILNFSISQVKLCKTWYNTKIAIVILAQQKTIAPCQVVDLN